jgi:lauroyl/myristoyl acyltransferase
MMIQHDLEYLIGDELGPAECDRVVRDFFRHKSCKTLDTAMISKDPQSYLSLVEVSGRENIDAALAGGKGAILATAHLNATNCLAVLSILGLPVTAISRWSFKARRPRRRGFIPNRVTRQYDFAHLVRQNIETSGEIRNRPLFVAVKAATVLRENEVIFIPIDVGVRDPERSVRLDFLNGTAIVLPGAVLIAKLARAPLLMTLMYRAADWRHQRLEISPAIPTDGDTTETLRRCLAFLDAAIRRKPAQWDFWGTPELRTELGLLPAGLGYGQKALSSHPGEEY